MAYLDEDPRSALQPTTPTPATAGEAPIRIVRYFEAADLSNSVVRMQNSCVAWDELEVATVLAANTVDEYVVLVLDASPSIRIQARDESVEVGERALVIVPAGASTIKSLGTGPLIRVFTTRNSSISEQALNADEYRDADPRCTPLGPAETEPQTSQVVVHKLSEHPVKPGAFGRIFQTADLMVNFLTDDADPRDPAKLSPHHHDDFSQISVCVTGDFIHHMRYPWLPDSTQWRDDEHRTIGSPSITLIPPPVIHTSQGIGRDQQLIDIFSPPRDDFGAQPGWVRNAADYVSR